MSPVVTPPALDAAQLAALLGDVELPALLNGAIASAMPLTRFRPLTAARLALRVDLDDGRRVKLRRVHASDSGGRIEVLLRSTVPGDFARVLAWRDRLVVEEWVEGRPLDEVDLSAGQIRRAGELLGRLHVTANLTSVVGTADDRIALIEDLGHLQRTGLIDAIQAPRVLAMMGRVDPLDTTRGLIHGDFSAENLIVTDEGRLCSIDNEDLSMGSVDGDLIRSQERWMLTPADWETFLDGYRAFRDPAAALRASTFWIARSRARSARVRASAGDLGTASTHVRALVALTAALDPPAA